MSEIRRHPREVKTILRRRDRVDPFLVGKFAFSPYHACEHGCLYCDGRAERYFVEGDFERDIVVRTNAPELLDSEVGKLRERGIVFIGSGVSDAYQPSERGEHLMERCARVLERRALPATLLTKSSMVLRDIETWSDLHMRAGFLLMMSITTTDDSLRAATEPRASSIEERFETIARFKEHGIPVGVAAMPLLPGLSDSDRDLRALAARLAGAGVDFVLSGGLTLRPGKQKSTFLDTVRRSFHEQTQRYEELYAEDRPSGAPLTGYARDLERRAVSVFQSFGLPTVIPHRLYRDRLPIYDEIDVLMQQMGIVYGGQPAAVRRLKQAIERFGSWLHERKRVFNRSRRMGQRDIEWELRTLAEGKGLDQLLENPKLSEFLRWVIVDRRVFDPLTKRLG